MDLLVDVFHQSLYEPWLWLAEVEILVAVRPCPSVLLSSIGLVVQQTTDLTLILLIVLAVPVALSSSRCTRQVLERWSSAILDHRPLTRVKGLGVKRRLWSIWDPSIRSASSDGNLHLGVSDGLIKVKVVVFLEQVRRGNGNHVSLSGVDFKENQTQAA